VLAACLFTVAGSAAAQGPARTERFASDSTVTSSTTGIAFVASAVLPGAGQFYLKSERWVPFIAVEAWAWVRYVDNHRRGRRLEIEYRDLAWNVARRITTTTRRDSVFTYYEAIKEHDSSGLFDADPSTDGLQPEENEATFNGIQWRRAKALFLRGTPATPGTAEYTNRPWRTIAPTQFRMATPGAGGGACSSNAPSPKPSPAAMRRSGMRRP
jgi:hypothetical protein